MKGVEIAEPHNLFNVLERSCRYLDDKFPSKIVTFSDSSPVDSSRVISSEIILSGMVYAMNISLYSEEEPIEILPYIPYFVGRLKEEKPDLELLCLREEEVRIGVIGHDFYIYGAESGREERGGFFRVFCGTEGLIPRNVAKKESFIENVSELTFLANLFFESFVMRGKGSVTHYLNLMRG
ncbi:MAG: hypothetical protein WC494_03515 [Candidatus Pacearchaeota archaeon]